MFKRRLTADPHELDLNGAPKPTAASDGCPDIWELESGEIAVIGVRKTDLLRSKLPPSAGCGIDEEIVIIPSELLAQAVKMYT